MGDKVLSQKEKSPHTQLKTAKEYKLKIFYYHDKMEVGFEAASL